MNRIFYPINNQQGSVMALALMVMVTLTIVGLFSINDTVMESSIARNHTLARLTLYLAEGASRQAAQILEDCADDVNIRPNMPLGWMPRAQTLGSLALNADFGDFRGDTGPVDYGDFTPTMLVDAGSPNVNTAGFLVVFEGYTPGGSGKFGNKTNVYSYAVYGRGLGPMANDRTRALIKVGYKMRY